MADEKVIRIEFAGDDGSNRDRSDNERSRDDERERREQRASDTERDTSAYEESRARNTAHQEAQHRADPSIQTPQESEINERIVSGSDEEAFVPPRPPVYDVEPEPDERHVSSSREIALYDPALAAAGAPPSGPPPSDYGPGPTSSPGEVPPPPVEPPPLAAGSEIAAGTGDSMVEGAAGFAALLGLLAEPVEALVVPLTVVAAGAAAMAVAVFEVTEALDRLHDNLTHEFETLNPEIASSRALQNAELIQQRIAIGQQIGGGASQAIAAQTGVEKELIEIRGHIVKMIETLLTPLYYITKRGLHIINWIWHHLPAAFGGFKPPVGGVHHFQRDAELMLNFLPEHIGARRQSPWGKKHPVRGDNGL